MYKTRQPLLTGCNGPVCAQHECELIQTRSHVRNAIASRERQVVMRKVKSTIDVNVPASRILTTSDKNSTGKKQSTYLENVSVKHFTTSSFVERHPQPPYGFASNEYLCVVAE